MKKTISVVVALVFVFVMLYTVFAAAENRVYGAGVSYYTQDGKSLISIPVKIEDNSGFMGFSIIVTYDADFLMPVSAAKGSILTGTFNDSIETSEKGSFKVVFSGTGDITADGDLFTLVFDVAENADGNSSIALSYSQPDTFKEGWDDVRLQCETIDVRIGTSEEPSTEESSTEETKIEEPVSSTEPQPEPSKTLSQRMRDWVNGLRQPFRAIMSIFVLPLAWIISLFE